MNTAHHLFDSLQTFDPGNGRKGSFYSLPALEKAGVGQFRGCRFRSGSCWNRCCAMRRQEGHRAERSGIGQLGGERQSGRRKSRSSWRGSFCRISPVCRCWWIWRPCVPRSCAMGKDPKIIEPLVPVDLVVDHSVQVDFCGRPGSDEAEPGDGISTATGSATNFSNGACRPSTPSRSCRPGSASSIR